MNAVKRWFGGSSALACRAVFAGLLSTRDATQVLLSRHICETDVEASAACFRKECE